MNQQWQGNMQGLGGFYQGHGPATAGSILTDLKSRIFALESELNSIEQKRVELARLKAALAALEPAPEAELAIRANKACAVAFPAGISLDYKEHR